MIKNKTVLVMCLLIFVILFTYCSKDQIVTNQNKLLGTWISIDRSDTLEFSSKNDFYKSNGYMVSDHYDYQLFKDSIEIGYKGSNYVIIMPTVHKYSINNSSLTIDFSNIQCYGFDIKEIIYIKEQ